MEGTKEVCVLIITEAVINYISGGGVMDVPLADRGAGSNRY